MNNSAIVALIIAGISFVGTVAMLIVNLVVANGDLKSRSVIEKEIATVRLELANFRTEAKSDHATAAVTLEKMRTEAAQSQLGLYQTVMKHLADNFVDRKEAAAMHTENRSGIADLKQQLADLSERVTV